MREHSEDTDQNFRAIFFIAIFSLFVLVFSNNQGNHSTNFRRYTPLTEVEVGNFSGNHNAIICDIVRLPDLQKHFACAPTKANFNPFSIQYNISGHNHRIAQNFIQIQKTRLTIEPLLLWRLRLYPSLSEKEDLPVLS
jgi:hypothetical protein